MAPPASPGPAGQPAAGGTPPREPGAPRPGRRPPLGPALRRPLRKLRRASAGPGCWRCRRCGSASSCFWAPGPAAARRVFRPPRAPPDHRRPRLRRRRRPPAPRRGRHRREAGPARDEVLPVYDFDPGVLSEWEAGRQAVRRGAPAALARLPPRVPRCGGRVRPRLRPRSLSARRAAPKGLRLPRRLELLAAKEFSADLEDRVVGVLCQALRRGVVATRRCSSRTGCTASPCATSAPGTEQVQLDLFGPLGYPDEARELVESEVRDWSGYTAAERRRSSTSSSPTCPSTSTPTARETLARREAAAAGAGAARCSTRSARGR